MHCLLCHEKIPRLRAWTGKSEFCCDEHADLCKKQTIDRLLVDDSGSKEAAPALPILGAAPASIDHILLKSNPQKNVPAAAAGEASQVDELWKLADRMSGAEPDSPVEPPLKAIDRTAPSDVRSQSAEDALAALQALAAEAEQSRRSAPLVEDPLDELSSMESSLEALPQLESLPVDLSAEVELEAIDEAPELELEALEDDLPQPEVLASPQPLAEAVALEDFDAPDLETEALAEALQESLEPPELAVEFEAEQAESLEPPDSELEELLAAPQAAGEPAAELSDPPEPADFETDVLAEVSAPAPVSRRALKPAPKMRPATELQAMGPSPNFPEGAYALKPWTDALAIAGPDRSSLFSPMKFMEMRKSSLNGASSAKFDPVQFRASKRIAALAVPMAEPHGQAVSYDGRQEAMQPSESVAWPVPLYASLDVAEMNLSGASDGISFGESFFSVKQPALSAEFLGQVALQSRVLEPRCSTILSPPERDVFASAGAEEEESGDGYASAAGRSDRDETDGGERVHVADLF